jgi:hypothetical protein
MALRLPACIIILGFLLVPGNVRAQESLRLENAQIGLTFEAKTGTLTAIDNKLTGETYQIRGDEYDIDAVEFHAAFADLKLVSLTRQGKAVTARYGGKGITVEAVYTLGGENQFAEKRLTIACERNYGLKKVVVSRPAFTAPDLRIVDYRPLAICTFFGRTANGGFFTGTEVPFDASSVKDNEVLLQFSPSLKIAANEKMTCEPVYFGVYRRGPHDAEQPGLPLRSESDAMVAMTSAILGPPRFGLVPAINGWCSEMHQCDYPMQPLDNCQTKPLDEAGQRAVEAADLKALDVIAQCGIDWYGTAQAWNGVSEKMKVLGPNDHYESTPAVQKFLKRSRELDIKFLMFATLNNSHPWWQGKPFRADRPDWLIDAGASPPASGAPWRKVKEGPWNAGGNCLGVREFERWLERVNLEAVGKDCCEGWCIDGDFFGGGGAIVPVDCQSDKHDHLPGDSNYACQQALARLIASIREHYPQTCSIMGRPPMDLGIWSLRNVDVSFTINELGTKGDNLSAGDQIRTWSRIRVLRQFLPNYMDLSLLFPMAPNGPYPTPAEKWPKGHFDYILLSALSSSPNLVFYLPLKTGFPDEDKVEIKKWLDWGRKNIEYLKVRKDLPDWPAADKIDGSAHLVGDRGLIFLFNPSQNELDGEFALTNECIGLTATGDFDISQEYPVADHKVTSASGQTVRWTIPPTTAVVLRIRPASPATK